MLGLRAFACTSCETVYALPAASEACARCGCGAFETLTDADGASEYFAGAMVDREEEY